MMSPVAPSSAQVEADLMIRLRNVRKIYRTGGREFVAVSDVTMDIAEGDMVSLGGPSGCGKSTLLRILAGLHDADEDEVKISTRRSTFTPGGDVGMVFQQALLLKWRTLLENVILPAEILGLPNR